MAPCADRSDPAPPERAVLDHLVAGARDGGGGALVLRGETGMTELLEYAAAETPGLRVIRLAGIEAESSYGFAAVHRLLLSLGADPDHVPGPQRTALQAAFGIVDTAADPFLVGLAVLTLLSGTATAGPLLLVVDDAHRLDHASLSVLAFVARRLGAGGVALVIAVPDPAERCRPLAGLPEIHLSGHRSSLQIVRPARPPDDLLVLAWGGRDHETRAAADELLLAATDRRSVGIAGYALTVLELGLSHYESAAAYALQVFQDDSPDLGIEILPDLVEAAARSGRTDAAQAALERLTMRTPAGGSPLARGLLARSRALLTDSAQADALYREAIEQPSATRHRARAHLLYGEWLRRRRRRRDAREHLSAAHQLFVQLGAEAFARRAWIELQATGATRPDRPGELTPQEAQVARLVTDGSSNRQVASQLFISRHTVEYHLQKIFRKLGVSSRTQLVRALLPDSLEGQAEPGDVARCRQFATGQLRDPAQALADGVGVHEELLRGALG
jgi:DNA-binding CsgD family transcriptional regulator